MDILVVLAVVFCASLLASAIVAFAFGAKDSDRPTSSSNPALDQIRLAETSLRAQQLEGQLVRLQRERDDLLFAARPLAEKTTWTFSPGPHTRVEEVARNERAEHLRQVIQGITGATLRPESMEEAGLRSIDVSQLPSAHKPERAQPVDDDDDDA